MAFSSRSPKVLPQIVDSTLGTWQNLLTPLVKKALPPATPANFQATNVRGGIKISWSPLQRNANSQHGPDGYEILRSLDGSFTGDVQVIPVKNARQTSYFDSFGSATPAHYRIRATAGSPSAPQSQRGPESGTVRHTSLDPSDNVSTPTTRRDNFTNDKTASMARFGNYGIEQYQNSPAVNSAPSSSGTGGSTPGQTPGGSTPSTGSVDFSQIKSGTNTGQGLVVGDGTTVEAINTGIINATEINGVPITGAATSTDLVPVTQGDGTALWQTPPTTLELQTDGVNNGSQVILNIVAGTNVTVTDDGFGNITIDATGGGGGGSPLTNIVLVPQSTGSNVYASLGGFTTFIRMLSRIIMLNPSTWTFSVVTSTGIGMVSAVVYRTLKDSLLVVDSTQITYSGLSTGITLPIGETFCDPISLPIDMTHDYYIAIYWDGASPGTPSVDNFTIPTSGQTKANPAFPTVFGGFLNSNQTTISPGGTLPVASLSSPGECILSQAIALS